MNLDTFERKELEATDYLAVIDESKKIAYHNNNGWVIIDNINMAIKLKFHI
jgi:hypothetical protein